MRADERTAFGLALMPVVVTVAILGAQLAGWRLGHAAWILGIGLGLAGLLGWWFRQAIGWTLLFFWALGCGLWIGQAALITCHGRGFGSWDWSNYYHIASVVTGWMREGWPPVIPGRPALVAVWSALPLTLSPTYGTFQVMMILANATLLPVVWLWGARLEGRRGAIGAVCCVLLSAAIGTWSIYTSPYVLAAALTLLALYCWTIGWPLLAGLVWAVAFQAHVTAGLYAAAFFASVILLRGLRPCFLTLAVYGALMGAWVWVLRERFPQEWLMHTPYVLPGVHRGLTDYLLRVSVLLTYAQQAAYPGNLWSAIATAWSTDPHAIIWDWVLAWTTCTYVTLLPLIGLVALPGGVVRWCWRRQPVDGVLLSTLLLGALLSWLMIPIDTAGKGLPMTAQQIPTVVGLMILAGAAIWTLPAWSRWPLAGLSVMQYGAVTGLWLWLARYYPSDYDVRIKAAANIQYLSEWHPLVPIVGGVGASLCGVTLCWYARQKVSIA